MGNLVIVAVPEEDDRVWKVSSEKVPHLTLLFLGDVDTVSNLEQIVQFVEHAANTSLNPFYLPVDRRGELGADQADVLFFKKNRYDYRAVRDFRAQLLQENNIKTAYDSATQFDGPWQPHLTLGYPADPAKSLNDDYGSFYSVCFNKIAVWTGDFEGPEFLLKDRWDEFDALECVPMDVAMSNLEHHGVKGMRWGQKKTETVTISDGKTKLVTPKKAAKLDASWEKNQFKLPKGIERHNAMAEHFNSRIGALNDKFVKDDFSKESFDSPAQWSPRFKEYNKELQTLEEKSFVHAVETVHGSSPTGKKKAVVETRDNGLQVVIKDVDKMEHASVTDSDEVFLFKVSRDELGRIVEQTAVNNVADSMAQSIDLGAEFLEHFGVKGMHWGQRSSPPPMAVTPKATSHVPGGSVRKTKIKVAGGENHPAHEDAIKVAEVKAKLKKSGPVALSNKELVEVQNRLNLEQNVSRLLANDSTTKQGAAFVKKLVGVNKSTNDAVNTGLQSHRLYKQFV